MQLQRMPADGSGKTGFCQPGGAVAALAEAREEHTLSMTGRDVERAMALVMDPQVTKEQLIKAVYTVCFWANQAVDVAECRGERLLAKADEDTEELATD